MKRFIFLAAMTVSASALASFCQVDLVETGRFGRNRVLTSFRSSDAEMGCRIAANQCQDELRRSGLEGRAKCDRRFDRQDPMPQPNPYPPHEPRPYPPQEPSPYPYPSADAQRPVNIGESVIVYNKFQTVIDHGFNNEYTVRSNDSWATITRMVRRENISVTSGCNLGLCVNENVINTISGKTLTLVGLSHDNTFVTRSIDNWQTITSWNRRENLAETKGCVNARYSNICVGDVVLNTFRREATVTGIQQDGRVVIEARDSWRTVTTNVDASSLVVIR